MSHARSLGSTYALLFLSACCACTSTTWGQEIINSLPNAVVGGPGSSFGITASVTVDDENGHVFVVDFLSGQAARYDLDLDPASQLLVPSPGGPANIFSELPKTVGIVWVANPGNPGDGYLYWIINTGSSGGLGYPHDLYRTNILGGGPTLLASDVASPGGGLLTGACHDDVRDVFLINDQLEDRFYVFDYNALAFTGESFANPDATGDDAHGYGIAHIDGTNCFDIITGSRADGGPANLRRVDQIGTISEATQVAAPFLGAMPAGNSPPIYEGRLRDCEWHASGSGLAGPQSGGVLYVFGGFSGVLFEIAAFDDCPPCNHNQLTSLDCSWSAGTVTGTYTENAPYDAVEVLRDGVPIANQPAPGAGGFTDAPGGAPGDGFIYEVRTTLGGVECPGGTSSVSIPLPGQASVPHAGQFPFGITVVESLDLILVADLISGNAYYYDRDLTLVDVIVSPATSDTVGVAWRPDTDQLYWLDSAGVPGSPGATPVFVTDTDGVFVDTFPVQSPELGLVRAISLNAAQDGFLFYDSQFAFAFETDFLGNATGVRFNNLPGVVNGNGIANVPDGSGYEMAGGTSSDPVFNGASVARIARVDTLGVPVGCTTAIGPGNFVNETFFNEMALTAQGGPGGIPGEFRYLAGTSTNTIYADPVVCLPCLPLAGGSEGRMVSNGSTVSASWNDTGVFQGHEVFRDGQLIASLPGDATGYSETVAVAGGGLHVYRIRSACTNGGGAETISDVFVFTAAAGSTDLVIATEVDGPGLTDSSGIIFDELVAAGHNVAVTPGLVGNDLSAFDAIWYCGGTGIAAHVLTPAEQDVLGAFALAGTAANPKALYLERPMIYYELPGTTLDIIDHVWDDLGIFFVPPSTLVFGGDITEVLGQDSQFGIDMAGIFADLDGENGSQSPTFKICELEPDLDANKIPDPGNPAGVSNLFNNTVPDYPETVVMVGDSTVSGVGGGAVFKIVNATVELGAYAPDVTRSEVIARYLDWFYPGGPPTDEFLRGDADGSGSFQGIVDGLFVLNFQFAGGPPPPCLKAADADDSGTFTGLIDGLYILNFQFVAGSPPPPPPYPVCGEDPTPDALDCLVPLACP